MSDENKPIENAFLKFKGGNIKITLWPGGTLNLQVSEHKGNNEWEVVTSGNIGLLPFIDFFKDLVILLRKMSAQYYIDLARILREIATVFRAGEEIE